MDLLSKSGQRSKPVILPAYFKNLNTQKKMENLLIEKVELISRIETQFPALNLAVCQDDMRPTMTYVKVKRNSEGQFWAYSTNGLILAEINFSYFLGNCIHLNELPHEFYLGSDAFTALSQRKAKWIKFNPLSLVFKTMDKDFKVISIFEAVSESEFIEKIGRFPDVAAVWPMMENRTPVDIIGLNFELINSLGKSLIPSTAKFPNLKFTFFGQKRPVVCEVVDPQLSEVCRGLIMPIMILD